MNIKEANKQINKLKTFKSSNQSIQLLHFNLSNTSQYVPLNNKTSNVVKVSHGVPQDTVLGPTHFLLFINYLPSAVLECNIILFADVTTII